MNMDFKIITTLKADADLKNILNYISENLAAPNAAKSFYDNVRFCYNNISTNPYMYAVCDDLLLKVKKYRKAVIKNYLMFYQVDEENKTIYICRFIYGRRNYTDLL